ncbi:hypothetical protein [Streptomyces canus]|uniref:hypothetical protein n=1 Tax=Streptomyces canus TaxID=58343 RepID=UPI0033B86A15
MTMDILGSGVLDPIGSDARRPGILAFLIFIGVSLLWLFTLATAEDDNPERLYVADRALSPPLQRIRAGRRADNGRHSADGLRGHRRFRT